MPFESLEESLESEFEVLSVDVLIELKFVRNMKQIAESITLTSSLRLKS